MGKTLCDHEGIAAHKASPHNEAPAGGVVGVEMWGGDSLCQAWALPRWREGQRSTVTSSTAQASERPRSVRRGGLGEKYLTRYQATGEMVSPLALRGRQREKSHENLWLRTRLKSYFILFVCPPITANWKSWFKVDLGLVSLALGKPKSFLD